MYSLVTFELLNNITNCDTFKSTHLKLRSLFLLNFSFLFPAVPWLLKYLTHQFRASILSGVFNKKTKKTRTKMS